MSKNSILLKNRNLFKNLAKISYSAPLLAGGLNYIIQLIVGWENLGRSTVHIALCFTFIGLCCGLIALANSSNFDKKGIFLPAIVGSIINGAFIAFLLNFGGSGGSSSILVTAAKGGQFQQVRQLVEAGIPVDEINEYSYTALAAASENGHLAVVKYLLRKGANPNFIGDKGSNTEIIPIFVTVLGTGNVDVLDLLLANGANVNTKNYIDRTVLHNASWFGHSDLVRVLLAHGASVDAIDEDGKTALILAA